MKYLIFGIVFFYSGMCLNLAYDPGCPIIARLHNILLYGAIPGMIGVVAILLSLIADADDFKK